MLAELGHSVPGKVRRDRRPTPGETLGELSVQRRRLLELYYAGNITADGFKEEESRLLLAVQVAREQATQLQAQESAQTDLELRFEQVASVLRELDIDRVWATADDEERRVLVEELVESITVLPDHLEVKVSGAPTLNVLYGEVGLKVPQIVGVGDGT